MSKRRRPRYRPRNRLPACPTCGCTKQHSHRHVYDRRWRCTITHYRCVNCGAVNRADVRSRR